MTRGRDSVVVIGGPTASGKSSLALMLADHLPIEIINFDSVQVYRGMDIGTAKPAAEDRKKVSYHLLDMKEPDEPFSVGQYVPLFRQTVKEIALRGSLPVAVGGTGLYLKGALGGLFEGPERDDGLRRQFRASEAADPGFLFRRLEKIDPETALRTMRKDLVRVIRALEVFELTGVPISEHQKRHAFQDRPFNTAVYCLSPPREQLYRWIEGRVDRMMEAGFLEEVRVLKKNGYGRHLSSMRALGYKELMAHLEGEVSLEDAVELIKRNTRRYAKRQITWFRGEAGVNWLSYRETEELAELAEKIVKDLEPGRG